MKKISKGLEISIKKLIEKEDIAGFISKIQNLKEKGYNLAENDFVNKAFEKMFGVFLCEGQKDNIDLLFDCGYITTYEFYSRLAYTIKLETKLTSDNENFFDNLSYAINKGYVDVQSLGSLEQLFKEENSFAFKFLLENGRKIISDYDFHEFGRILSFSIHQKDITYLSMILEHDESLTESKIAGVFKTSETNFNEYGKTLFKELCGSIEMPVFCIEHSNSKIIQAVIDTLKTSYPPKEEVCLHYNELLIKPMLNNFNYENDKLEKTIGEVLYKKKFLESESKELFDTKTDDPFDNIYILDQHGRIFVERIEKINHNKFKKTDDYGKPIACGGHITVKNGKITYMDNLSGHYKPNLDQLKLAIIYLNKKGVLDENVQISYFDNDVKKPLSLEEVLKENKSEILEAYQPLEYYNPTEKSYSYAKCDYEWQEEMTLVGDTADSDNIEFAL